MLDYELDAPGSGDELQVSGLLTLGGALNVSFSSGFCAVNRPDFRPHQRPHDGQFRPGQLAGLGQRHQLEHEQLVRQRDHRCRARTLNARPVGRRCDRPAPVPQALAFCIGYANSPCGIGETHH